MITKEQYFELVKLQALVYCQIYIYSPNDKALLNPIGFGSGFLVDYQNKLFLITADHVIHRDDYENKEERTGKDFIVAILNNFNNIENEISTVLTPLEGFYYAERLQFSKKEIGLVDVATCLLKEINFQYPFHTHEISIDGDVVVQAGIEKKFFNSTQFTKPTTNQRYAMYGVVYNDICGIKAVRTNALYSDISYSSTHSDKHIFIFPNEVNVDLAGMSGSPIFDYKGNIVGVVNRIIGKGIWATPIEYATMLMDLAIKSEKDLTI